MGIILSGTQHFPSHEMKCEWHSDFQRLWITNILSDFFSNLCTLLPLVHGWGGGGGAGRHYREEWRNGPRLSGWYHGRTTKQYAMTQGLWRSFCVAAPERPVTTTSTVLMWLDRSFPRVIFDLGPKAALLLFNSWQKVAPAQWVISKDAVILSVTYTVYKKVWTQKGEIKKRCKRNSEVS